MSETRRTRKRHGGYRATARDKKYLRLWRQGKSVGFTMRSSLKAKGLIPRANGTYRVSNKYKYDEFEWGDRSEARLNCKE
jgi:hypothetical protein